eukprot:gnl/TRDRNA2_/TRDRNA2_195568_c0_seq1.p1 gnl/TRDRNA2_/TRDRNA2_195568_c0~~gnl/TRDRNA2_/TRDRNA2_195568_c0_seq1.p1  ORF type:complete len:244 (-),score=67.41 gnl/TRDRNA2_/TRDRNA2_195568_c0_seq1:107-838(-)
MPTTVYVSMTPALQSFLGKCRSKGGKEHVNEDMIDLDEVYRIVEEHHQKGGTPAKIHELLEGSEVVDRRQSEEAPMTELERMRLKSQERQYQQSVQGVAPLAKVRKKEATEQQQGIRFATNFATQVIVAFIGAFALGYFFVETFVDEHNFVAKVIAGAFCSFFTLLLESCLFIVHESKERMITDVRQRKEDKDEARRDKRSAAAAAKAKALAESSPPAAQDAEEKETSETDAGPKTAHEKKVD